MKDAKQEILEILEESLPTDYLQTVGQAFPRIRAILSTHTLEPIDDRPFEPEILGFRWVDRDKLWRLGDCIIMRNRCTNSMWIDADDNDWELPVWPTQSDGERLLKLLGVLK